MVISGHIVDVVRRSIFKARLYVKSGKIADIQPCEQVNNVFIMPGLIDAHVHIESSMVVPSRFAQNAVRFGVVAAVADPHEIANVCGVEGVRFMVENGRTTPFKFYFGAPSCVPATSIDNSGATISAKDISTMFDELNLSFLAEMMNFPGVIQHDPEVWNKIRAAIQRNLPIDGHAPNLTGDALVEYIKAGIETDHECTSLIEAEEKIKLGMKILIREGSASQNFNDLFPLIDMYPDFTMLCTDDYHPENFSKQYLNRLIPLGISKGLNTWNILQALTINPVSHYRLNVGLLQPGDPADFIVVDSISSMNILQTWIEGNLVFDGEKTFDVNTSFKTINNFNVSPIDQTYIKVKPLEGLINIIQVVDKQIYTRRNKVSPKIEFDECVSDTERDILKIVVLNRYKSTPTLSVGFVQGFELKEGALASSISHDSHNIVAVGVSNKHIVEAINLLIHNKGGISYVCEEKSIFLELPVGGIMSDSETSVVASKYQAIQNIVHKNGCRLTAPFMTLSFLSLLVIPTLKISDQGLFDVEKFQFIDLFEK